MPPAPNSLLTPTASFLSRVTSVAGALPLTGPLPPAEQLARVESYCQLLLKWNATLNVTGAKTVDDLVDEHIPDALVAAEEVPQAASVMDVGSGGGLPALPLAVLRPDLALTLVEPRAKRVAFLRTAVRELGLVRVQVLAERLEDVRTTEPPQVAISRATFPPEEWAKLGLSIVGHGGSVFAFLAQTVSVQAAHQPTSCRAYRLPRGQERFLARFTR